MLNTPTVINAGHNRINVNVGDEVTMQCHFNASTMKDVTIVLWMKDDQHIKSSEHYNIATSPVPIVGEDRIESNLKISNVTTEDLGTYSCYCQYNRSLVASNNTIVSENRSFVVELKGKCLCDDSCIGLYISLLCSKKSFNCVHSIRNNIASHSYSWWLSSCC